eukprot:m.511288 g.511288  ORF g.511288 m.511288 type:complete len:760 (-) comp21892_c1_seq10:530-2809(-)
MDFDDAGCCCCDEAGCACNDACLTDKGGMHVCACVCLIVVCLIVGLVLWSLFELGAIGSNDDNFRNETTVQVSLVMRSTEPAINSSATTRTSFSTTTTATLTTATATTITTTSSTTPTTATTTTPTPTTTTITTTTATATTVPATTGPTIVTSPSTTQTINASATSTVIEIPSGASVSVLSTPFTNTTHRTSPVTSTEAHSSALITPTTTSYEDYIAEAADGGSHEFNTGLIAGGCVGGCFLLTILFVVVVRYRRCKLKGTDGHKANRVEEQPKQTPCHMNDSFMLPHDGGSDNPASLELPSATHGSTPACVTVDPTGASMLHGVVGDHPADKMPLASQHAPPVVAAHIQSSHAHMQSSHAHQIPGRHSDPVPSGLHSAVSHPSIPPVVQSHGLPPRMEVTSSQGAVGGPHLHHSRPELHGLGHINRRSLDMRAHTMASQSSLPPETYRGAHMQSTAGPRSERHQHRAWTGYEPDVAPSQLHSADHRHSYTGPNEEHELVWRQRASTISTVSNIYRDVSTPQIQTNVRRQQRTDEMIFAKPVRKPRRSSGVENVETNSRATSGQPAERFTGSAPPLPPPSPPPPPKQTLRSPLTTSLEEQQVYQYVPVLRQDHADLDAHARPHQPLYAALDPAPSAGADTTHAPTRNMDKLAPLQPPGVVRHLPDHYGRDGQVSPSSPTLAGTPPPYVPPVDYDTSNGNDPRQGRLHTGRDVIVTLGTSHLPSSRKCYGPCVALCFRVPSSSLCVAPIATNRTTNGASG